MKYFKKLEEKRIYLSPMNSEDVEKYVYWMSDRNVTDNLENTVIITTLEEEKDWLINAGKMVM